MLGRYSMFVCAWIRLEIAGFRGSDFWNWGAVLIMLEMVVAWMIQWVVKEFGGLAV